MKNKLKVVICVVMTCVFLLIPFSAFAYVDNPSPQLLVNIAKGANKDMYTLDSSHSSIIFEDKDNYYFVIADTVRTFTCGYYGDYLDFIRNGTLSFNYQKYVFPKSNIYDVSFNQVYANSAVNVYFHLGIPTKILYCNQNVYKGRTNDIPGTEIFFQKMNSVPNTPGNRVPLNTQLSSIQLTGTLSELIAMLPILLPVLITLLAIRKGIGFTLRTLRIA